MTRRTRPAMVTAIQHADPVPDVPVGISEDELREVRQPEMASLLSEALSYLRKRVLTPA